MLLPPNNVNLKDSDTINSFGIDLFDRDRKYISASKGPSEFNWLVNGLLGGVSRPGNFSEMQRDIASLEMLGVSLLVTLTNNWRPPVKLLAQHNITSLHLKIVDLHAPKFEEALKTCRVVNQYLKNKQICVYHCQAGKGRTGTMLAAQLIYNGYSADTAVFKTRSINSKWIETDIQMQFLEDFEKILN